MIIPIEGDTPEDSSKYQEKVSTVNMRSFGTEKPSRPLHIFFIHHSCGGQLLARAGDDVGDNCIYQSHSNGGGLRDLLEGEGYVVHEASYGSEQGEHTDLFDWLPKFRDLMDKILRSSGPDTYFEDNTQNSIIAFKSCFPNNLFLSEGTPPGNPFGPELTIANAKASYTALLDIFSKHPDVLFVPITAPPLLGGRSREPIWKHIARMILNKPQVDLTNSSRLARKFNNWLKADDGYLKGYPHKNIAVFDYFDILTGYGESNRLIYPSGPNSDDNHPNKEGNTKAAAEFILFLNGAVHRAGILD
jgi:hypothetical protein